MNQQHTNRLIHEKSPYLLQHAHNPVDWYPWGEEAFQKAREEGKPIFLSIGYATCHWCHVMERESFENDSIATYLNEHFVAVKVDREERPDLDKIYMNAVQAMTGRGGWPLSVFLTPSLQPFYGGTYFPPENRFGIPGFLSVLRQIQRAWETKREEIRNYAEKLTAILRETSKNAAEEATISPAVLDSAFAFYSKQFDARFGGFGSAPKFPRPVDVQFLLRYYQATGNRKARQMALFTLDRMAAGGMYDQLGGGFHRYSTDEKWRVPHFEKMLYDNALLAIAYTEGYQVSQNLRYQKVVAEILRFVAREMTDKGGGFYSAQDADSEGEEGKYYLWRAKELKKLLEEKEYEVWRLRYGVSEAGNYERGLNIFYQRLSIPEVAEKTGFPIKTVETFLHQAAEKLFRARCQRVKPLTDDKVLASWSALMISAYARAYAVFQEPEYLDKARKALHFILQRMMKGQQLFHRYRDGETAIDGFLDDYAFLIQALLDYYEVTFDLSYLQKALSLLNITDRLFLDEDGSGYFFSSKKKNSTLVRMKVSFDGALPSGHSLMVLNLLRLAEYTMNDSLRKTAEQIVAHFARNLQRSPLSFTQMLLAIDFYQRGATEVVLALPDSSDDAAADFLHVLNANFFPNKVVALLPGGKDSAWYRIIPWSENRPALHGKLTAYVCQNFTCRLPTTEVEEFKHLLEENLH